MKTFGKIKYYMDMWIISEIEPHAIIRMKSIFHKIPRWKTAPYVFDDTPEVCNELVWFLQRYPLEINSEDLSRLTGQREKHLAKLDDLERLMRPDYSPRAFQIKGELRKYQSQAVEVLLRNKFLLNGDDVGLGKTLIAIGAMSDPVTLPALVVVQTHLPFQWREMIERFLPGAKVHLIKGTTPYQLPVADVYIMKYSCLAYWTNIYEQKIFKMAVFDEVQELRISSSQKYNGGSILTKNVNYKLGLSATPIYNYGDEIYNILNLLGDGCLGKFEDFQREWCGYQRQVNDPKALGTYLRENFFFLRRTREEVQRELPVVNKIVHTVEYDEEAVKSIETLAKRLAISVTTGSFIERGKAARELDIMVRQATGVSKAKYVADYVSILLRNGEPVLLAGWHRDVYDIWLKELKEFNPVMYTGSESPAEKERSKQSFIKGDSNLMIISLRSGVGLDGLQARSSIVVFGELDWSPAVHEQVTGRLNRDGQQQQVTAIYLVSDSGSDPLMVDLLGLKSSQAKAIIDPLASVQTQHSDDSRIKLLAEQYLKEKV